MSGKVRQRISAGTTDQVAQFHATLQARLTDKVVLQRLGHFSASDLASCIRRAALDVHRHAHAATTLMQIFSTDAQTHSSEIVQQQLHLARQRSFPKAAGQINITDIIDETSEVSYRAIISRADLLAPHETRLISDVAECEPVAWQALAHTFWGVLFVRHEDTLSSRPPQDDLVLKQKCARLDSLSHREEPEALLYPTLRPMADASSSSNSLDRCSQVALNFICLPDTGHTQTVNSGDGSPADVGVQGFDTRIINFYRGLPLQLCPAYYDIITCAMSGIQVRVDWQGDGGKNHRGLFVMCSPVINFFEHLADSTLPDAGSHKPLMRAENFSEGAARFEDHHHQLCDDIRAVFKEVSDGDMAWAAPPESVPFTGPATPLRPNVRNVSPQSTSDNVKDRGPVRYISRDGLIEQLYDDIGIQLTNPERQAILEDGPLINWVRNRLRRLAGIQEDPSSVSIEPHELVPDGAIDDRGGKKAQMGYCASVWDLLDDHMKDQFKKRLMRSHRSLAKS